MSIAARIRMLTAPSLVRVRAFASALAVAISVVGCGSETMSSDNASLVGASEADGGSAPGWLLLDWSIAGDKHAEQCDLSHSATVAVTVATGSGETQRVYQTTCLAFNATIQLDPGDYRAEAVLLDSAGADVIAPVALQPFEISSGLPVRIPLEFPASSFNTL
jgi:hypothetical protein